MDELPRGTVTFIFTDIEGSTRLAQALGSRYAELLAQHRTLLRGAFAKFGGRDVETKGDALVAVFESASAAVAAAVECQWRLEKHPWPSDGQIRVRMGLHTGEPMVDEDGYLGLSLHRAARVCSAGHGGQVLLSSAARELVADDLPEGVGLRDLGEHWLKDLVRPERLFQLVIDGLRADFPPLMTVDRQEGDPAGSRGRAVPRPRGIAGSARRHGLLTAALIGVLAAAISIPVFALGRGSSGGGGSLRIVGNQLVVVDPVSNRVVRAVPVGSGPDEVVSAAGSLWVANSNDSTIARVDPRTFLVQRTIATAAPPTGLAGGKQAVWFVSARGSSGIATVGRIDPRFDAVAKTLQVRGAVVGGGGVAADRDSVWIVPGGAGHLTRLNLSLSRTEATFDADTCCPASVSVGPSAVWVADPYAGTLTRIERDGTVTSRINLGGSPSALVATNTAVWVALRDKGVIARVDPQTDAVVTTVPVGDAPSALAVGDGYVWVANSRDGTISRVDPRTNTVVATVHVGASPQGIAVAAGKVWVTVRESATNGSAIGDVVHVNAQETLQTLDPALGYSSAAQVLLNGGNLAWQVDAATCLKLVTYPDGPGVPATELVPDGALSMPTRSRDGRTYAFTIRKGLRFSPPSNELVTAQTFKYAIERSLSPEMAGPARTNAAIPGNHGNGILDDVVGAVGYEAGEADTISGIVANGDTLTITLLHAAPDLLARLAEPYFCAVPTDTPEDPRGISPIPSAGPYYLSSFVPGESLVLTRNPNYTGDRPHRPRQILVTMGVARAQSVEQVEAGKVDYAADGVPPEDASRLMARYGQEKDRSGRHPRYLVSPTSLVWYLALNTSRPLFGNPAVRQAVNYALNRRLFAQLAADFFPSVSADHYLPPTMPGFRHVTIYPPTPNLARARRLAGRLHATAVFYTCALFCVPVTQEIVRRLAAIGIDVVTKELDLATLQSRPMTRGSGFDLSFVLWDSDVLDPYAVLNVLFDGSVIRNSDNTDVSYFDDPKFNEKLHAAARLTGSERERAYGRLDVALAQQAAPMAALVNVVHEDFISARIGCEFYQPAYGLDLAALCVRRSR